MFWSYVSKLAVTDSPRGRIVKYAKERTSPYAVSSWKQIESELFREHFDQEAIRAAFKLHGSFKEAEAKRMALLEADEKRMQAKIRDGFRTTLASDGRLLLRFEMEEHEGDGPQFPRVEFASDFDHGFDSIRMEIDMERKALVFYQDSYDTCDHEFVTGNNDWQEVAAIPFWGRETYHETREAYEAAIAKNRKPKD